MPPPTIGSIIARERKTSLDGLLEQARQEQWTLAELAQDLGVTDETARTYIREHGYETYNGIRPKRDR